MGIKNSASNMDLRKSIVMGLDEFHIALLEGYGDLTDEQFWRFAHPDHLNIASYVLHCLQQHKHFHQQLLQKRGLGQAFNFPWFDEERFTLWNLPAERLPKPTQAFPTVAAVREVHARLHGALVQNLSEAPDDVLLVPHPEKDARWPRGCDVFFRGLFHGQAHLRQIWYLRGLMGIQPGWPVQHFA